jgi:hypothetical protein
MAPWQRYAPQPRRQRAEVPITSRPDRGASQPPLCGRAIKFCKSVPYVGDRMAFP